MGGGIYGFHGDNYLCTMKYSALGYGVKEGDTVQEIVDRLSEGLKVLLVMGLRCSFFDSTSL